jgi:hypothetical protein
LDLWEFVDFFFFIFFIDFIKNISQKNISQLMSSIYPKHSNHHLLHIKPWIFLRFSGQKWQKSPRKPSKMAVLAPRSDCCAGKGRPGQDDPGTVCEYFCFLRICIGFSSANPILQFANLIYNLPTLLPLFIYKNRHPDSHFFQSSNPIYIYNTSNPKYNNIRTP